MPEIETDRLILRPLLLGDLDEMAAIRADPQVMRYIDRGAVHTREQVLKSLHRSEKLWNERGLGRWGVRRKESETLMGWCGLFPLDETEEIEIGYGFAREFWGHGYATEAAAACLRHGFEFLELGRIVAVAYNENTASLRVLEKIGMRFEKRGHYYGAELPYYALNRDEYRRPDTFYALSYE